MLQIATLWISSISYIYCIYLLISILSLDWQTYHYFWPCFFRKNEREAGGGRGRGGGGGREYRNMNFIYMCACVCVCVCVLSVLSRVWLCGPMDWSLPGSSVHGIFQARILEWVAISWSRGSSQPCVSCISCTGRRFLYHCSTWEANMYVYRHICF